MLLRKVRKHAAVLAGAMLSMAVTSGTSAADEEYALDSDAKQYSYAVGTKIASQLMQRFGQNEGGVDFMALRRGMIDVLDGADLLLEDAEIDAVIERQREALEMAQTEESDQRKQQGQDYLAENQTKEGVVKTDSGLQYRVLTTGDGDRKPTAEDTVVVHYQGTLIDGTVFDSSYARGEPATFSLTGIIPGWQEVLQLMTTGDKWAVAIPSELGYGEKGAGGVIGPDETLLFDIELIEIK